MNTKTDKTDLSDSDTAPTAPTAPDKLEPWYIGRLFHVERKSDIVAFVSAIISIPLSLSALAIALKSYSYSPKIEFHRPAYVLFVGDDCHELSIGGRVITTPCVTVVASMVYSNSGDPGHNDIVLSEIIKIRLPFEKEDYVLEASAYVVTKNPISTRNSSSRKSSSETTVLKERLSWSVVSDSYPVSVKTTDVESHETLFGWNKTTLILPDKVFGEKNSSKQIDVTFEVQTKKSGLITEVCTVKAREFRDSELDRWAVAQCYYEDDED